MSGPTRVRWLPGSKIDEIGRIFDIFDHILDDFWSFLVDFGSARGPGGSGEMVEGSGRGQLRAWQGPGRGQGPRSGSDFGRFWRFWAVLGHFWDPVQNPKNSAISPGPLKKMALRHGILTRIGTGGSFWGQKFD